MVSISRALLKKEKIAVHIFHHSTHLPMIFFSEDTQPWKSWSCVKKSQESVGWDSDVPCYFHKSQDKLFYDLVSLRRHWNDHQENHPKMANTVQLVN